MQIFLRSFLLTTASLLTGQLLITDNILLTILWSKSDCVCTCHFTLTIIITIPALTLPVGYNDFLHGTLCYCCNFAHDLPKLGWPLFTLHYLFRTNAFSSANNFMCCFKNGHSQVRFKQIMVERNKSFTVGGFPCCAGCS